MSNFKYILMCGGNYPQFKEPKQLLKINGEVLVERIIRQLKENGIEDIVISTNTEKFDYLGLPIIMQNNKYIAGSENEKLKSECCWLNAYPIVNEPCCYIHGDVYFSDEAIKTIVNTPVKDTMFFCTYDWIDGQKDKRNYKGREPFAYKVKNYELFQKGIKDLMRMVDEGFFKNGLPPICWHLYRYLNGLPINTITTDWKEVNNIFDTKGDYIIINDYTTDIDHPEDAKIMEEWLKK